MSAQRPPNLTITQLLHTNLSRKGPIGLVKHILTAHFDFGLEVFANEEQEQTGRGDDDFGLGVKRSGVEMMHYICDGLDRAIPGQLSQLDDPARNLSAPGDTNILKFPPTKN